MTIPRRIIPRRVVPLLLCLGLGLLCLAFSLALVGCWSGTTTNHPDPEDEGPEWFKDVTAELGIDFVHDPGPTGEYHMWQAMGHGCAFIHDDDGSLYIYLLQTAGPDSKSVNRLYKRQPDGKFKDVTAGSGLDVAGYNLGVAVGDVNNDGKPDVFISQYGGVRLFLNLGGGHFEDITEEAGLKNPLWGASAAFFDYDRDGWLDLFVANYVDYDPTKTCKSPEGKLDFCGPIGQRGKPSKLYHNLGPQEAKDGKPAARVRFEDVSVQSGISKLQSSGLGVFCYDFNDDGWPDIFVTNDGHTNYLWINQQDGTFKEEGVSRNVAYTGTGKEYANMGIAPGDYTNTGMMDLFVTHLNSETNTLWRQGPKRGYFKDRTIEAGLTAGRWRGTGFGTLAADFDLAGFLDIAIANGGVTIMGNTAKDTNLGFWEPYAERNQLFANDGTGKFKDVSAANKAFCGYYNVARGLACTDFDDDGAPDLLITATGDRARLFRNVAPKRGHYLKVRAVEPRWHNRDSYGAEVRVRAGGHEWLRLINPAESYLSSGSPIALFGLGKVEQIESIQVRWPDGTREEFPGGSVDRLVKLSKGEGHKQ